MSTTDPVFVMFSLQHISVLLFFIIATGVAVYFGRRVDEPLKSDIGMMIAGLTLSTLLIEGIYDVVHGTYNVLDDLPFYLCDIVTLMLPFVLYYHHRKWIGILYFWALGGTLQAILTPDLHEGFPHFHFFRYFLGHAGIIMAVVYTVMVKRIRIKWNDFVLAIIYAQVYLVVVHIINYFLGSNYGYTMGKPPGGSLLDYMGPWPWYILVGELVMVVMFLLLLVPFLFSKSTESAQETGVSS